MSPSLSPRIARLFSLGALAVAVGIVAVYALALFISRPNVAPVSTGGIDAANTTISWIAFTMIAAALIIVHIVFARQLASEARGERRGL